MYYDDEARRYNFISGLLIGAVLGTGLALIVSPKERLRRPRRIRGSAERLRERARAGVESTRSRVGEVGGKLGRVGRMREVVAG